MRVIFYCEPFDHHQKVKTTPDKESIEAKWVTLKELAEMDKVKPYLRGYELVEWATYIEQGGEIGPLTAFQDKNTKFD